MPTLPARTRFGRKPKAAASPLDTAEGRDRLWQVATMIPGISLDDAVRKLAEYDAKVLAAERRADNILR